ncbi:mechanosensitive ion channel family protein [Bryobacter aggregatus]|uniref:mechanosensitive ion channel family protein n=1 Tax=Bryobacter aggregatus TaxID=360054 RepID=UPI00068AE18D|nr:mechanosensitive ion channel domain-containing protein [Bryobacter aggregatus]
MILPNNYWQTLGATTLIVALIALLLWLRKLVARKLDAWRHTSKEGLAATASRILPADRVAARLHILLNAICTAIGVVAFIRYLSYVLELYKETQEAGHWIVEVVLLPFKRIFDDFIAYIPNLFNALAIIIVTRYLLAIVHRIFREVGSGRIVISGFYPDWADPTYKLIRFLAMALALVGIFPYLPGSSSPAFQTISVFLGVLLSLGSSSVVSNLVSGTILTYMRALRIGDRVKIGDTSGDVIERTMLVTRVKTIKNEVVTIPNAILLTTHITNYSTLAQAEGLIIHTEVTIGYDVPWPDVHQALLEAARRTPHLLSDPSPFILQTALNDFNVSYELNAYTREANRIVAIRSELYRHIQDTFDDAQIEIMSPIYNSIRQSTHDDTVGFRPSPSAPRANGDRSVSSDPL